MENLPELCDALLCWKKRYQNRYQNVYTINWTMSLKQFS